MPTYTGNQSILDAALGDYAEYGFRLEEDGDDFTLLYFKDKRIATYNAHKLTIPLLHEGCRNYLKNINGG